MFCLDCKSCGKKFYPNPFETEEFVGYCNLCAFLIKKKKMLYLDCKSCGKKYYQSQFQPEKFVGYCNLCRFRLFEKDQKIDSSFICMMATEFNFDKKEEEKKENTPPNSQSQSQDEDDCVVVSSPILFDKEEFKGTSTPDIKEILREEYEDTKKFYFKLKGYNQYDLTLNNFEYWKKQPFVGKWYIDFIKSSSKIMVLTCLINERIQIHQFDKLVKTKKEGKTTVNNGILKYVKSKNIPEIVRLDKQFLYWTEEQLKWRLNSHLYRFGYIRKFIKDEYCLDINDFKTYKDVEKYFEI